MLTTFKKSIEDQDIKQNSVKNFVQYLTDLGYGNVCFKVLEKKVDTNNGWMYVLSLMSGGGQVVSHLGIPIRYNRKVYRLLKTPRPKWRACRFWSSYNLKKVLIDTLNMEIRKLKLTKEVKNHLKSLLNAKEVSLAIELIISLK